MRLLATPVAKTATVRLRQVALPGLHAVAPLRYTDADPYRVLRVRFVDGAAWEDIPYIRKALRKVRAGEVAWGGRCRSETYVRQRCAYHDGLQERLLADGYHSDAAASAS